MDKHYSETKPSVNERRRAVVQILSSGSVDRRYHDAYCSNDTPCRDCSGLTPERFAPAPHWRYEDEHEYDEGWGHDILQGLGQWAAACVFPRLALIVR